MVACVEIFSSHPVPTLCPTPGVRFPTTPKPARRVPCRLGPPRTKHKTGARLARKSQGLTTCGMSFVLTEKEMEPERNRNCKSRPLHPYNPVTTTDLTEHYKTVL